MANKHENPDAINPEGKPITEMPAGHKRDEQLKVNADLLEQHAEEKYGPRSFPLDEEVMEIDREICSKLTAGAQIPITNAQPGYRYLWVLDSYNYPRIASYIAGLHSAVKAWGYEPVSGDMPEAHEFIGTRGDTTRTCGDVTLYRITERRYHALGIIREKKDALFNQGADISFQEAGARYMRKLGFNPASSMGASNFDPNSRIVQRIPGMSQEIIPVGRGAVRFHGKVT